MKTELLKRPCVLILILFSVIAVAQVASTELQDGGSTGAVSLPFFVNDRQGNPVLGMPQPELSILDNRKPPQSVPDIRSSRQLPLRIGVIFDVSGSETVSPTHELAVKALAEFLKQVVTGPQDKAFVAAFSTVPHASAFMDRDELSASKVQLSPGAHVALFDAISLACNERMRADPSLPARRVLVILSNGRDYNSKVNENKAIAAAQASGTVIFALHDSEYRVRINTARTWNHVAQFPDRNPDGDDPGGRNLEEIADSTGGRYFGLQSENAKAVTREDVAEALTTIKQQIDNMYSVTFIPVEPANDGKFHSVEFKSSADPKLKIRASKGYYVSSSNSKR